MKAYPLMLTGFLLCVLASFKPAIPDIQAMAAYLGMFAIGLALSLNKGEKK